MGKAPAFQTYAADFYMDTAGWDPYALGMYWRLLMYSWINEGLPQSHIELARISGASPHKFEKFWGLFLSEKWVVNGKNKLINRRQEEVRESQSQFIESQREKGKKSAKKRWGENITGVTGGLQPEGQPDCNSSSSLKKEIYKERKKPRLPDEEWILILKKKDCYSHLNVDQELEKCITYFEAKGVTVSRQRFLNWLNNPRNQKPLEKQDSPYRNLAYVKG